MDLGLSGKHVVITGASGGIGLEITRVFLGEGAKVTGTFNRSSRAFDDIKKPDSFLGVQVDQTSENDVKKLFEQANLTSPAF